MRDDDEVLRELVQLGVPTDTAIRPALRVLTLGDLRAMPQRGYLLKWLLSPAELSVWWGAPKCGKSFLLLYIAFALAQGRSIFGRRVRGCTVLYAALEGTGGIANRVRGLELEHGDAPQLRVIAQPLDLLHPEADLSDLIAVAKEHRADLIVIDTASRALAGGNENGPEDMGGLIRNIDAIRQATGAHVAVVHHGTKNGANGPRGHSSLIGAADAIIEVTKREDGSRTATVTDCKDDADGAVFGFRLRVVTLGIDEDGDTITTCIAEEAEAPAAPAPKASTEARARQMLADTIARQGAPLPTADGFPLHVRGVSEAAWRAECDARRLSTAETKESRSKTFKRAYQALLEKRAIAARDGWVWFVRPDDEDRLSNV